MVVECPKCKKRYRADETEVPPGGGPVRCPSCENIFTIYREPLDIELIPVEAEVVRVPPEEMAVAPSEVEAVPTEVVPEEMAPAEVAPEMEAAPTEVAPEEMAPAEVSPEMEAAPGAIEAAPPYVKPPEAVPAVDEDRERARRLARALVKDIILYHPQEVERGLREGRLSELVGDEIRKSWKYYKERIPKEIVDTTNYFKDALNDVLCKGKKVFT